MLHMCRSGTNSKPWQHSLQARRTSAQGRPGDALQREVVGLGELKHALRDGEPRADKQVLVGDQHGLGPGRVHRPPLQELAFTGNAAEAAVDVLQCSAVRVELWTMRIHATLMAACAPPTMPELRTGGSNTDMVSSAMKYDSTKRRPLRTPHPA